VIRASKVPWHSNKRSSLKVGAPACKCKVAPMARQAKKYVLQVRGPSLIFVFEFMDDGTSHPLQVSDFGRRDEHLERTGM
jgi:hypothetical protein